MTIRERKSTPRTWVNVEEFLFGGVAEEVADEATADVGGELSAGDATDEADDVESVGALDDATDATAGESDVSHDAGEQDATAGPESSEDLKVVLSLRGGRAIIGVRQPSADPHIECFDGLDFLGLALQGPRGGREGQGPVGGRLPSTTRPMKGPLHRPGGSASGGRRRWRLQRRREKRNRISPRRCGCSSGRKDPIGRDFPAQHRGRIRQGGVLPPPIRMCGLFGLQAGCAPMDGVFFISGTVGRHGREVSGLVS